MNKFVLVAMVSVLAILLVGCSEERMDDPLASRGSTIDWSPQSDTIDPELVAGKIVALSGWEWDSEVPVPESVANLDDKCFYFITDYSREMLTDEIAHYTFTLRVGWGEYEKIKIHRVVKEQCSGQPIRTRDTIFLQHGDAVGFVKFLYGAVAPSVPDDHASAIFLAQNDVDVWGIDQNWVMVPEETTDFSFMQGWGMDNQVSNLRIGLGVARITRLFTGNGFGKMHLLGYSSGGWLGFAYLNDEAARPRWNRHVKGFVCADAYYIAGPDNEVGRLVNCDDAAYFTEEIANGVYEWWVGFAEIGNYALDDPDGPSPIFEGFTNMQVALYFGAAGFQDYPLNEWWHYWGGTFEGDPQDSFPNGLRFIEEDWAAEFMTTASPWQATPFFLAYSTIGCGEADNPWDDNLGDINVPILNLGGAGGLAPSCNYTLSLLGSSDIQEVIVQLLPDDQKYEDFGHIDMWTATDAEQLVWAPMLDWIVGHPGARKDDQYPLVPNRD